jgi:hypothetical protein
LPVSLRLGKFSCQRNSPEQETTPGLADKPTLNPEISHLTILQFITMIMMDNKVKPCLRQGVKHQLFGKAVTHTLLAVNNQSQGAVYFDYKPVRENARLSSRIRRRTCFQVDVLDVAAQLDIRV